MHTSPHMERSRSRKFLHDGGVCVPCDSQVSCRSPDRSHALAVHSAFSVVRFRRLVRDALIRRQPGIIVRQCAGGGFLFARTACFTSVSAPALRCPRCVQMLRGSPASVIGRVDTI